MRGRPITWSDAELAWIEEHRHMIRREAYAAFVERFNRTDVTLVNYISLCKRHGWSSGRTGRFEKGQISHNKGKKGVIYPGCEKGWFKPGVRRGVATKLYQPIGSERVGKSGYIERKVNDDLPPRRRWRAVHLIRWEGANGTVPEGHVLKCLDGDRTNTAPDNWVCVPRALLPRLAAGKKGIAYDTAPAKLKPTLLAIARLEHAARERRSEREKEMRG